MQPPIAVPWRRRLLPLASVAYVAWLGVWADRGTEPRAWLTAVAALVVALLASRRPTRTGRVLGWGGALVLASLGAVSQARGLEACGDVGALACAATACVAVARMPAGGGVVQPVRVSPWPAAALVVVAWWAALVARLAPESGAAEWAGMTGHAAAWSLGAALTSVASLLALAEWSLRRRGLELGVVERALAMRGLLGTACAAALLVALVGRAHGDAVGRALVAGVAVVLAAAALAADAVRVARLARRVVVLAIVGGGVALLGATAADGRSWGVALVTALVVLAVGAAAPVLEAPLRPARGAWLDAFAAACDEAARGDPDEAVRGGVEDARVISALRSSPRSGRRP